MVELTAIFLYFAIVFLIGYFSYKKNTTSSDFIIGNRSLNYWLTALAAHASDMSSWLFMAYPAMILIFGLQKIWIAFGLVLCMFFNWQFIAPKIRIATEKSNSLTFFSYLEKRFDDRSGMLKMVTSIICFAFYTIYISSGLIGLGLLIEGLFNIPYELATLISILIAIPYVLIGGYRTLAWLDLFQGLFLMVVIVVVPCYLFGQVNGWEGIFFAASSQKINLEIFPSLSSIPQILLIMLGWGLGYFGQPTIITKFMGIKNPHEISKSKWVGMSWMVISLFAATFVGLVGIAFFKTSLSNPEMVFIELVKNSFSPFLVGFILCAIFAASINVISSQILVISSSITEDFYRKLFKTDPSPKELLNISRIGVLIVSLIAFIPAYLKISSIYTLVLYAWSGLGSSFGPLLISSLYFKKMNKKGAWAGLISGTLISALWPWLNAYLSFPIDPIIIGFASSFLAIGLTSLFSKKTSLASDPVN